MRKLRQFRAWLRAWRLGFYYGRCPVCDESFSCEDLLRIPFPEFLLSSPRGGQLVCAKPTCQTIARELNRATYGFISPSPR
jgi:hypothetical protein